MTIVSLLFDILVGLHVATGFVGLAAFWIPVFARKGGRAHVQAGRVFTYCAYVVTLSAVTASVGRILSYQVQGIGSKPASRTGPTSTASVCSSATSGW